MSRRQGGRVQAPDIRNRQRPEIQPAPLQSDTFQGAPQVGDPGRNYFALADALGGFSNSLQQLGAAQQQKKQDTTRLQNEFSRLNQSERRQVARTGMLPSGEAIAGPAPALMKASGRAEGFDWGRQARDAMQNEFDWQGGDIDEWLTENQNEYIDSSGISDPMAIRGFHEEAERVRSWAYQKQEEIHAERTQEITDNVAFKNLEGEVYSAIEEGWSPEEVHRRVRGAYKDIGQEGTLGMGYDKLDRWVINLAGTLAEEHPETAIELLTAERDGAGPASAPLRDKLASRGEVDRIIDTANRTIGANELAFGVEEHYRNNMRRIVEEGDFTRFEDAVVTSETTGETHTISATEQKEQFQRHVVQWGDSLMEEQNVSRSVADRETMNVLMNMGIENPVLLDEIDGLEQRFGIDALQDEESMNDIVQRVDRWRSMKETYPTYTNSHLSEDTLKFLRTTDSLIRTRGLDTPRAVEMAQRVVDPNDRGSHRSLGGRMSDIDSAIDDHMDQRAQFLGVRWGFGSTTQRDEFAIGAARGAVQRDAEALYATGEYTVERSIEIAAENYAATVPHYRGAYIAGLEQYPRHELWQEGLDSIIGNFQEDLLPGQEDTDLTVRHYGGGRLLITDSDGQVLTNQDGITMATNIDEVNQEAQRLVRSEETEAVRDAATRQRLRQDRQPSRVPDGRPDAFTPSVRPHQQRPTFQDTEQR